MEGQKSNNRSTQYKYKYMQEEREAGYGVKICISEFCSLLCICRSVHRNAHAPKSKPQEAEEVIINVLVYMSHTMYMYVVCNINVQLHGKNVCIAH